MKHCCFLLALLLCQPLLLTGQVLQESPPEGGGSYPQQSNEPCLSDEDRAFIQEAIQRNVLQLRQQGKLPLSWSENSVQLAWPLEVSPALDFQNYYAISGYVDQDNSSGIQDYNCEGRSYDGHQGTDYFTWPFPWLMYENDFVSVVASAPGTIVFKQDGQQDDRCQWLNGVQWNAIYVMHDDGSVAWYGHMKENGLSSKNVGDQVATGEFLGYLASSGRSSGPHLHLEIYDSNNQLVDPYSGDCDDLATQVNWAEAQPYREPTINALLTHDAPPELNCPSPNEQANISDFFAIGDPIIVGAYYKDQLVGSQAQFRIVDPNGQETHNWTQTSPNTYNGSWWWWTRALPINAPTGVYTVEMAYNGQTVTRPFNFGTVSANEEPALAAGLLLSPNPTSGRIFWSVELPPATQVEVLDYQGKTAIAHQRISGNFADLSNLPGGLYFLRFTIGGKTFSRKIVKE